MNRTDTRARSLARHPLVHPWYNAVITAVLAGLIVFCGVGFWRWAVADATTLPGLGPHCLARGGACWSFVQVKWRLILFGFYPPEEDWRPVLVLLIALGLPVVSAVPRFWSKALCFAWGGGIVAMLTLLYGGVLGLPVVPLDQWSGLPLTVMLSLGAILIALPSGILLALARQSSSGALRTAAVVIIELVRGIPLVTALFIASVVLPLFTPPDLSIPKIIRALFCFSLFLAAYLAEAIRSGLQAIPHGQREAAAALGLRYCRTQMAVVLPQALRISLPGLINAFLDFLQATSLVVIIGLFDLLGTTRAAIADSSWQAFYVEAYLTVGLIYFMLCFPISKYAVWLEHHFLRTSRK